MPEFKNHVKPFVYAVLANDRHNEMNLRAEYENFENAFLPFSHKEDIAEGKVRMFSRSDSIIRGLEVFLDDLSIFYFAGHANAKRIQLEDGPFNVKKLSFFLNNHACPNIRLVFLNACYTHSLVSELLDSGIPLVIACKKAVSDEIAMKVAKYFWELLLNIKLGESLKDIVGALERYMKLADIEQMSHIEVTRGLVPEEDEEEPIPTYGIYYNPDENIARLATRWIPIPGYISSPRSISPSDKSISFEKTAIRDKNNTKEHVKELIAIGHVEEAIGQLRKLAQDSYYENDAIGLQGRFNGIQRQKNLNTLRSGEYERTIAQIRESLFYILRKI